MQPQERLKSDVPSALQLLIDDLVYADSKTPGAAMHVEAPALGLSWGGAVGVTDFESDTPLTPHHPLRVASITKTFVAASLLRLWEEGRLELDASVSTYLPADYTEMMQHGGYRPDVITVRHLLTHTSGLFDYATSETFLQRAVANPTHCWTRAEHLQGAMHWGFPYGAPGEVYRYSDTGYILLGEILERLTDLPLAAALRQLINYDGLGLTSTWMEGLEKPPSGARHRASQYVGRTKVTSDPSGEGYGAGGLLSTTGDLARFMRGVFTGGVYRHAGTIDTMLTTIAAKRGGPAAYGQPQRPGIYRMGVLVTQIDDETVYQHTGFWGTMAVYVPRLDAAIGGAVTQRATWPSFDFVLRALSERKKRDEAR
jgi:D-alanyl-D-alanine carboxypeptidase